MGSPPTSRGLDKKEGESGKNYETGADTDPMKTIGV